MRWNSACYEVLPPNGKAKAELLTLQRPNDRLKISNHTDTKERVLYSLPVEGAAAIPWPWVALLLSGLFKRAHENIAGFFFKVMHIKTKRPDDGADLTEVVHPSNASGEIKKHLMGDDGFLGDNSISHILYLFTKWDRDTLLFDPHIASKVLHSS